MHLNKAGFGMTSKTACGRNTVNTPMSISWAQFKLLPEDQKCAKCAASKQAALNARSDAKLTGVKVTLDEVFEFAGEWIPVADPDAWKAADAALIAKAKAKRV